MVQTGGLSRPLVRLASTKVELYEDEGGLIPCINWTTALFLPTDWPAIGPWKATMGAAYTLMVDEECCLSSISCRNEITDTSEVTGSKLRSWHQAEKINAKPRMEPSASFRTGWVACEAGPTEVLAKLLP